MWNSCSEHHVVEGIGPHKGPSEYILACFGDDVKLETKLFPRLPKFQHRRHSPPPSPAISYPTPRFHHHLRLPATHHPSLTPPPTCPNHSPGKPTSPQQSVHTPGSRTAPPSSCLQLIKPCRLNTATHYLYQLQIQPCLKLIKPHHSSQQTCTYNPATAAALPSFGRMGNHPPAAHAGPAHRLDEIQTREQHTQVKLSENSGSDRVRTTQRL